MKNTIRSVLTIMSLILLSSSCAASLKRSPLKLEFRTLEISATKPALVWQYCTKVSFWNRSKCRKGAWRVIEYDLTNPETRKKLKDMGFVLKVRRKL